MSPILVRPVREQLEHDRLVRLLQTKSRRRFDAEANPGNQQNVPVRSGTSSLFPDLLLFSQDRGRRLQAVVEVETGESVNHLEALAQWAPLSKLKVDFYLYVPANMVDVARRLCEDNKVQATEIWSYHLVGDQFRFTLMHRAPEAAPVPRVVAKKPAPGVVRRKLAQRPAKRKPAPSAVKARAKAKPVRKTRPQKRR
ncbi:MAG: hypothetical protein ABJA98_01890 [Acidobacteriota bacterium]